MAEAIESDSQKQMQTRLIVKTDDEELQMLNSRAQRQIPRTRLDLPPLTRAIQFLRGVHSRATLSHGSFYIFLGSQGTESDECLIQGYPGCVLKHVLRFSSLSTISLGCRKAFDNAAKGMTGGTFAKIDDEVLGQVAEYWAANSRRPVEEAQSALILLRSVFQHCSKSNAHLLQAADPLSQRVALLKQYADRSAAHLSLDSYEVSIIDCAHVVAALTILGEIIRSFDDAGSNQDYFDVLDRASLSAAKQLFPSMLDFQLFGNIQIEMQSRLCWQWGVESGMQMLLERLPHVIGSF